MNLSYEISSTLLDNSAYHKEIMDRVGLAKPLEDYLGKELIT